MRGTPLTQNSKRAATMSAILGAWTVVLAGSVYPPWLIASIITAAFLATYFFIPAPYREIVSETPANRNAR